MFENFKFDKREGNSRPGSRGDGDDPKKSDPSKKEKSKVTVEELPLASPFSINETPSLDEPKRSLSLAISDVFRRGSETSRHSGRSRDSSPVRKGSTTSHKSHFWESRNPDYDSEVPRRGSIGSNNANSPRLDGVRKAPYVSKNATASFLKTASAAQTAEEKEKLLEEKGMLSSANPSRNTSVAMSVVSGGRQPSVAVGAGNPFRQASIAMSVGSTGRSPSVALSDTSEVSSSTFSTGRRPSGVIPNNVASRYMRSASQTSTDEAGAEPTTPGGRRRSAKSRQNSGGTVKPVQMAPESYAQWQNSVSKAMALQNVPFHKPGDNGRMQNLGGIADLGEEEEPTSDQPAPTPPTKTRGKHPSFSMVVKPATPERGTTPRQKKTSQTESAAYFSESDATRMDSHRAGSYADPVSPTSGKFAPQPWTAGGGKNDNKAKQNGADASSTTSDLESLGFVGAVPA
ncbi:hypothetical protein ANO11243_085390 [Dothideomycetidae sp. 11243]|nr:hypothetical protein ANO11243_085390 [fungal sp. No.11243]